MRLYIVVQDTINTVLLPSLRQYIVVQDTVQYTEFHAIYMSKYRVVVDTMQRVLLFTVHDTRHEGSKRHVQSFTTLV
jgi:hypothetical protein